MRFVTRRCRGLSAATLVLAAGLSAAACSRQASESGRSEGARNSLHEAPPQAVPSSQTTTRQPEPAAAPSPRATPRLVVEGTAFSTPDGTPFQWRGITAFRLLEGLARGRQAEVVAYLDWAAAQELTVIRVLTMARHLFRLSPAEGRAALPTLLDLAAARGLYVEIVALADTLEVPVDLEDHVRQLGDIAARHSNAVLEIANEPVHPTQQPRVHDAAALLALANLVPDAVPVALGSVDDSDAHAAGDYVTVHLPRDTGDGGWGHVTALASAASLPGRWNKPVVSDEPIGAAAEFHPGRRDNDPARFRAAALLTRLAGLGATFHYEGGLHAQIPTGRELECFQAWNDAWRILPADIEHRGTFASGGSGIFIATPGPRGLFARRAESEAWAVLPGPEPDTAVSVADGWEIASKQALPGATIVQARRASAAAQ